MFHFSDDGLVENGEIRFQIKATDHLRVIDNGRSVSVVIEVRDLMLWGLELYPFILVVFDAQRERAFWLHIQDYIQRAAIDDSRDRVTLRIPFRQKIGVRSIDHFRRLSLETVEAFWERNPSREQQQ
jgi:hypothetical protein